MRNKFQVGDILEVVSPTDSFQKSFKIEKIVDQNRNDLQIADKVQQLLFINCDLDLQPMDILRK